MADELRQVINTMIRKPIVKAKNVAGPVKGKAKESKKRPDADPPTLPGKA